MAQDFNELISEKEKLLDELIRAINQFPLYSPNVEHVLNNFRKLQSEKTEIIKTMLNEAKDFKSMTRIRLEKDERALLKKLHQVWGVEWEYNRKIGNSLHEYTNRILPAINDLDGCFQNKEEAKEFFNLFINLFKNMSSSRNKLFDHSEKILDFVHKWKGGFFSYFVFKKHKVLDNFKSELLDLLKLIEEEEKYKKEIAAQVNALNKVLQSKATKLLLLEEKGLKEKILEELARKKRIALEEMRNKSREAEEALKKESSTSLLDNLGYNPLKNSTDLFDFGNRKDKNDGGFKGGGGGFGGGGASGGW